LRISSRCGTPNKPMNTNDSMKLRTATWEGAWSPDEGGRYVLLDSRRDLICEKIVRFLLGNRPEHIRLSLSPARIRGGVKIKLASMDNYLGPAWTLAKDPSLCGWGVFSVISEALEKMGDPAEVWLRVEPHRRNP
jgi:hypothetical protein